MAWDLMKIRYKVVSYLSDGEKKVKPLFESFKTDVTGNFSIILGLALMAIVICIGAAIDISQSVSTKSKMQDSLDTAVLAYAGEFLRTGKNGMASNQSEAMLDVNDTAQNISKMKVYPVRKVGNEYHIRGTAKGSSENRFMKIVSSERQEINVESEAVIEIVDITAVVVPDISWSMKGEHLESVKKAMEVFGDEMFALPSEFRSRLQMGVVPFAGDVNISEASKNSSNLLTGWKYSSSKNTSPTDKSFYNDGFACNASFDRHSETIRNSGKNTQISVNRESWENVIVGFQQVSQTDGRWHQIPVRDWRCVNKGVVSRHKWSGCIQEDNLNLSVDSVLDYGSQKPAPPTLYNSRFPHCPTASMQSNIRSTGLYKKMARDLDVGFATSHDKGILWAARLMEPNWASFFGQSQRPWNSEKHPKYMIILSDGKAKPIGYSFGNYGQRTEASINSNSRAICDFLKDKGVTIYGISYTKSRTPESVENIKYCASKGLHFDAGKSDLEEVFKTIASHIKLQGIRLSH